MRDHRTEFHPCRPPRWASMCPPPSPSLTSACPTPSSRCWPPRASRPLSPSRRMTIADALAGRDVSAKAPTGSGKTLAFALPVAAMVRHCAPKKPQALVLVPTRELALQISDVLAPLLRARGRRVAVIYGGVSYERQRKAMRNGVDVVVACPGRLEDLMQAGTIRLADVRTVVLDEADRMADMGFLPAVRRILDATAPQRQTLLFSATLDGEVDVLVRRYQKDPVRHEVVNDAEDLQPGHPRLSPRGPRRPAGRARRAGRGRHLLDHLRAHQAQRRPGGDQAGARRHRRPGHPRGPLPGPARADAQGVPGGPGPCPRGHRRGGTGHPCRRRLDGDPLRPPRELQGLRAPLGKDGPGGSRRRRHRARHARAATDGRRPAPHARPRRHRRRRGPSLGRRRPPRCPAPPRRARAAGHRPPVPADTAAARPTRSTAGAPHGAAEARRPPAPPGHRAPGTRGPAPL